MAVLVSFAEPGNILILILALVEPALILYVVYWYRNRKDASLDTVIKLFAVGTGRMGLGLRGWGLESGDVQIVRADSTSGHGLAFAIPWSSTSRLVLG